MLTQECIKSWLNYDEHSGVFTWRKKPARKTLVGDVAGFVNQRGYVTITIQGKRYKAHKLAILYVEGYLPLNVDHITGKSNAYHNLRACTSSQNNCNKGLTASNKSGAKGVHYDSHAGKWRGVVYLNKKQHHVGLFTNFDEAVYAVKKKREELHGEFCNHGE